MKTLGFITVFVLMATVSFAQNQDLKEIEVTAPKFHSELYLSVNELLNSNVEYPAESKNAGLQGTEVVRFVVTRSGKIRDFVVVNSVSSEIDNEVIRLLEATNGKWNPGTTNGIPVNMKTEVSVAFFMHSAEDMIKTAKNLQQKGNNWMFEKNNPVKALKFYNRGIVLLPNEESLLAMRGLCNYQIGSEKEAIQDWERIKELTQKNSKSNIYENLANLDQNTVGLAQMVETLNK